MAMIFICYRRDDSEGYAILIRERLAKHFGSGAIFQDITSIPPGKHTRAYISEAVQNCRFMLVLIDNQWLHITDPRTGQRRLEQPDDFVRLEITAALEHGLHIIPVLLRGTPMPRAEELPDPIKPLADRNAHFIHSSSVDEDIERLSQWLKQRRTGHRALWPGIGGVVLAGLLIGLWLLGGDTGLISRSTSRSDAGTMPDSLASPSHTPTATSNLSLTEMPTATVSHTPEPTRNPSYVLAEAGVSAHSEWIPHIERFDEVPMALVPAGCFTMGSTDGQLDYAVNVLNGRRSTMTDEQPTTEICFDKPFWIDVTEVTNAQFRMWGGQAGRESRWTADNRPRESINWFEATEFCKRRGARLPTEAEWEYAASGPEALIFPWGNTFVGENVVWNTLDTADAGSKPQGASWVGALDMSGDVWEWVSSLYQPYPYDASDGREVSGMVDSTSDRVIRGGGRDVGLMSVLRTAYRQLLRPITWRQDVGFRCARSY